MALHPRKSDDKDEFLFSEIIFLSEKKGFDYAQEQSVVIVEGNNFFLQ